MSVVDCCYASCLYERQDDDGSAWPAKRAGQRPSSHNWAKRLWRIAAFPNRRIYILAASHSKCEHRALPRDFSLSVTRTATKKVCNAIVCSRVPPPPTPLVPTSPAEQSAAFTPTTQPTHDRLRNSAAKRRAKSPGSRRSRQSALSSRIGPRQEQKGVRRLAPAPRPALPALPRRAPLPATLNLWLSTAVF